MFNVVNEHTVYAVDQLANCITYLVYDFDL